MELATTINDQWGNAACRMPQMPSPVTTVTSQIATPPGVTFNGAQERHSVRIQPRMMPVTNGQAVSSQPTKLSGSSGELWAMRASSAKARMEAISAARALELDMRKVYPLLLGL